jgi:molecular chaperone Hsp33
MNDFLYSGQIEKGGAAFSYAVTTALTNEAVVRHDCDPVGAHLLARALTVGLLAAASGGADTRFNVRWSYRGALQAIVVDAGAEGTVRGLINPPAFAGLADTGELYGDAGEVRVVRSRGGTVTASGTAEACFMDVADDLAAFLCISDQVESAAAVRVAFTDDPAQPVRICRGFLLQAMPDTDLEQFQQMSRQLNEEPVVSLLSRPAEPEQGLNDILQALTPNGSWQVGERTVPRFLCRCSVDKMGTALRCLSYADRVDIVQKQEDVSIRCHFCNERYVLTVAECIRAWNEKDPK